MLAIPRWVAGSFYFVLGLFLLYVGITGKPDAQNVIRTSCTSAVPYKAPLLWV
jgi:hypothetical protein